MWLDKKNLDMKYTRRFNHVKLLLKWTNKKKANSAVNNTDTQ